MDPATIAAIASGSAGGVNLLGNLYAGHIAQKTARETNAASAYEAAKQRDWASDEAVSARVFSSAEAKNAYERNMELQNISQMFSATEARKAREFSQEMSDTSWQRAVSDMRKAGINPMLAFMKGGASTPVAASASGSGASVGSASTSIPTGATARFQQSKSHMHIANAIKNGIYSSLDYKKYNQEIKRLKNDTKAIELENKVKELEIPALEKEFKYRKSYGAIKEKQWSVLFDMIMEKIAKATSSALGLRLGIGFGKINTRR